MAMLIVKPSQNKAESSSCLMIRTLNDRLSQPEVSYELHQSENRSDHRDETVVRRNEKPGYGDLGGQPDAGNWRLAQRMSPSRLGRSDALANSAETQR